MFTFKDLFENGPMGGSPFTAQQAAQHRQNWVRGADGRLMTQDQLQQQQQQMMNQHQTPQNNNHMDYSNLQASN